MSKNKIDIEDLQKIFFNKNLVSLSTYEPKTPPRNTNITSNNDLTPMSKSIYDAVSPASKPYILMDLISDNAEIDAIENKMFDLDPDYQEKMENQGLGFFMEEYLCVHGFCPVCNQQTLKKYQQPNIPVVDLVCVNTEYHLQKNECFLFQVKISLSNTSTYFSLKQNKIVVGSKIFGNPSHLRLGTDYLEQKLIVPGYICLKLNNYPLELQTYVIDQRNSFVLIPKYHNNTNNYYYMYTDKRNIFGKNIITWNQSMVDTLPISLVISSIKINHEFYSENILKNPYKKLLDHNK